MKENYQPWQVNLDDFWKLQTDAERLRFLLNFAVLAPSSHNSQPWSFSVNQNSISVFLEPARRLVESDKNDRQAHISLGCALKNLEIAADYYGYLCTIEYFSAPKQEPRIKVGFEKTERGKNNSNHLILAIPKRHTNRNRYEETLPPESFLAEVKSYVSNDRQIYLIKDRPQKDQLADIALQASIAAMEDKNFRFELSCYVKPNTTSSTIGMPAFGMGIPTPVSLIAPVLIRFLNLNKLSRKSNERLLKRHTPFFGIIATRSDTKTDWVKTGQVYEKIALLAAERDIKTQMWTAPIEIGEYYKKFQEILQTDFRPQAFFRLGYTPQITPHSPRLSAVETVK